MWALYSDSKFAFLASEFGSQVAKCQYWVTILGILAIPRVVVCFMESMLMLTRVCATVIGLMLGSEIGALRCDYAVLSVCSRQRRIVHRSTQGAFRNSESALLCGCPVLHFCSNITQAHLSHLIFAIGAVD